MQNKNTYPKFKLEEKKNSKLTEKQVEKIIDLRKQGMTYGEIRYSLKLYNVSQNAIIHHCLKFFNPERYREKMKLKYLRAKKKIKKYTIENADKIKQSTKERRNRKGQAYKNYDSETSKEYSKKNKKHVLEMAKKRHWKNREENIKKSKKYREENLLKLKEKDRIYYYNIRRRRREIVEPRTFKVKEPVFEGQPVTVVWENWCRPTKFNEPPSGYAFKSVKHGPVLVMPIK